MNNKNLAVKVLAGLLIGLLLIAIGGGITLKTGFARLEEKIDGLVQTSERVVKEQTAISARLRDHEVRWIHTGAEQVIKELRTRIGRLERERAIKE